jgi:hypothetical protein
MVPLDFKAAARQTERLTLVVDGYSANLPWEMLYLDGKPLCTTTRIVRQFASTSYRKQVKMASDDNALVIGNPTTTGFLAQFPSVTTREPADLPGATAEAQVVAAVLKTSGFGGVKLLVNANFTGVMSSLFNESFRIVHIAAHGAFQITGGDGISRSGVLLSNGKMLTANELALLEAVPELVFLNCCHLGQMNATSNEHYKLANSLARELIQIGVRCVIAAGWEVDDNAGAAFAAAFYEAFARDGETFGDAMYHARNKILVDYPASNTWGAYQAYGDPSYSLRNVPGKSQHRGKREFVAEREVIADLRKLRYEYGCAKQAEDAKVATIAALTAIIKQPSSVKSTALVCYEIGRVYGDLGKDYFADAVEWLAKSIALEPADAPISTMEQLANLEARLADDNANADVPYPARLAAISRTIDRTVKFREIRAHPDIVSRELNGILGSAYKRRAVLVLGHGGKTAAWAAVRKDLVLSLDAYLHGFGSKAALTELAKLAGTVDPYTVLNAIQLALLIGEEPALPITLRANASLRKALLSRCREEGANRYAKTGDFFDAVTEADVSLTEALMGGAAKFNVDALKNHYQVAMRNIPISDRQINSVKRQLGLLAAFYRAKSATGNAHQIATKLDKLQAALNE